MKLITILIIILPFNGIFSQQSCCYFFDKIASKNRCFITKFNNDSTNHCLVVMDTETQQILLEYNYGLENPYLNLKGDLYGEAYRVEQELKSKKFLKSFKKGGSYTFWSKKRDPTRRADIFFPDPIYRVSRYILKNFEIDSINGRLKDLIQKMDFPYCNDFINIHTISNDIFIKPNRLESIISNKLNFDLSDYAIIQDRFHLHSCGKNQLERRLAIISSRGDKYTVTEKYDLGKRPWFSHDPGNGVENDFDIIELDSTLLFFTYVSKKINIYDLESGKRIKEIETKIVPHKYKALKINNDVMVFIPKPIRIGGYDLEKLRARGAIYVNETKIKDEDDSITELIVYDRLQDKVYIKKYRIDKIESIQEFDNLKILFNDGSVEEIGVTFSTQNKK